MKESLTALQADYKPGSAPAAARPRVRRRFLLLLALTAGSAGAFEFFDTAAVGHGVDASVASLPAAAVPVAPLYTTADLRVAPGDNLATLFADRNLSASDLQAIIDAGNGTERLKRIVPGDVIRVAYTPDGHVQTLHMGYDDAHTLDVVRQGAQYNAVVTEIPTTITTAYAHGVIENSLFDAATRAGLSDGTTMGLIQLFAWDIDFAHDIQNGDRFTVIYQKIQRQGQAITDGPILAAEFDTTGSSHQVLRYTDAAGTAGYYTPDGHSIRKTLMRAPISYSRISSGFSLHRMHPLLGFSRAHQGVDYAAPSGTPVKAAGDGRVTFVGVKGGYGKCLIIDHGGGYSTLYAHLSHFKVGMHAGARVTQEQVIGFVGMTGLATGPHLHFEVRINGVARNPRTVPLPNATPVLVADRAAFDSAAKTLLAELGTGGGARVASTVAAGSAQANAH